MVSEREWGHLLSRVPACLPAERRKAVVLVSPYALELGL